MITINLYWNNICLLHRQELVFLNQIRQDLLKKDIDLKIQCFGLGYEKHMAEYLNEPDSVLPDMIVTSDLEVYEDAGIYGRLAADGLHPLPSMLPVKKEESVPDLICDPYLLPYLAIPLVFYGEHMSEDHPCFDRKACAPSLDKMAELGYPLAFGGLSNSAGRALLRTLKHGKNPNAIDHLLSFGTMTDMPIEAFQRARLGQNPLALIPSIYAFRADGASRQAYWPSEGAIPVTSYICARKSIPAEAALAVSNALRSFEIGKFYVENGCVIFCAPNTPAFPWAASPNHSLRCSN